MHSHEIQDKTHPLTVSQTCQAKLGMTKRVRDGSITLDDDDAQSLEVFQQVETGLFMIGIEYLIRDEYVCNPLLNDLVIDLDDESDDNSVARDSEQSIFPMFSHMRWSMLAVVNFRGVCFRLIRLS